MEAKGFTEAVASFHKLKAEIVGISPDSGASHARFREKHDLSIILLSDPEKEVLKAYGAFGKKSMYGKEVMGVIRSTFLIDPAGKIVHLWRKVKVKGHVAEVLETLKELQKE